MKVIVQHNFRDKENALVLRTAGEELEVSRKRAGSKVSIRKATSYTSMQPISDRCM